VRTFPWWAALADTRTLRASATFEKAKPDGCIVRRSKPQLPKKAP
jgi:hypothetical protein